MRCIRMNEDGKAEIYPPIERREIDWPLLREEKMTALSKDPVGLLQALRAAETDDDEIRALLLSAENYVTRDVRFEATMAAERVGEDPDSTWEDVALAVLDTVL